MGNLDGFDLFLAIVLGMFVVFLGAMAKRRFNQRKKREKLEK